MFPKISVIVPVYNVEKYLHRCVDSLLNQTSPNIEIVLVNDGSTDNCAQICDEYTLKHANVIVKHKENGGQSSARNVGLENATGDYIGFVDSDDWVEPDMYEYLYNLILKYEADASQIGYCFALDKKNNPSVSNEKVKVFCEKNILQHYMTTTTTTGSYSVCRCLFKKTVLNDIFFREGKINEDIDFKYKVLSKCKRYVVSNLIKYNYFQISCSTTRGGLKKRDFDLYDASEALYTLTRNEDFGTIRFLGEVKRARTEFSLLCKIAYYGVFDQSLDKKIIVKKLLKGHRNNVGVLLRSPMPMSRKILSLMFAVNFSITEFCIHLVRK